MKENKSPGFDGIPPKLLKEIVEEISIPLANVLIGHLKRELFHQNRMEGSKCYTIILKAIEE